MIVFKIIIINYTGEVQRWPSFRLGCNLKGINALKVECKLTKSQFISSSGTFPRVLQGKVFRFFGVGDIEVHGTFLP